MSKILRLDADVKAFAINAGTQDGQPTRTLFAGGPKTNILDDNVTAEFLQGWGFLDLDNEDPTAEDFNAAFFTLGQFIAYLHQTGVAEWNTNQEYHIGSIVHVDKNWYTSLTDTNVGNDPDTDTVNWRSGADNIVDTVSLQTIGGDKTFTDRVFIGQPTNRDVLRLGAEAIEYTNVTLPDPVTLPSGDELFERASAVNALFIAPTPSSQAITAVSQGAKTFQIDGVDFTKKFVAGVILDVSASTGNDDPYTTASSVLVGSDTVITVVEAIPDATADGVIDVAPQWQVVSGGGGVCIRALCGSSFVSSTFVITAANNPGVGIAILLDDPIWDVVQTVLFDGRTRNNILDNDQARALSNLVLTNSFQNVPNCSLSLPAGTWYVTANIVESIVASAGNVVPGDVTAILLNIDDGATLLGIIATNHITNQNTTAPSDLTAIPQSHGDHIITLTETVTVKLTAKRIGSTGVKTLLGGSIGSGAGNYQTSIRAIRIGE